MNLGFIILYVNDLDKAKAFYTDVLGLKVWEEQSGPMFVALRPDVGSLVALQDKKATRVPPGQQAQNGSVEVSFAVDDVDGTWKHWKDNGVEIVSEPMDVPFGRYFMAKDPEGFYISAYRFTQ